MDDFPPKIQSLQSRARYFALRVFWGATAVCLGLSALALISVSGGGFHYKSQQTAVLNVIGFLVPAWVVIAGISGSLIVLIPRSAERSAETARSNHPEPSPQIMPPPLKPHRFSVLTGVSVFLVIMIGDVYMNHGKQLALVLPMALVIAAWAGYREKRRV